MKHWPQAIAVNTTNDLSSLVLFWAGLNGPHIFADLISFLIGAAATLALLRGGY